MLKTLRIKNIALVKDVTVSFTGGMNCLTGETGAGKSIIIDSIGALLGYRVRKDIVRSGCESGLVSGEFTGISKETAAVIAEMLPPELIPEEGGTVTLEREISQDGRNVSKICGRTVTSANLRRAGETLIDIHGQSESRLLRDSSIQLQMLDSFAGKRLYELLCVYRDDLSEYRKLKKDLEALSGSPQEREREIDLLGYQIREIDGAQLSADEETYLSERIGFLSHAEKIKELLDDSLSLANGDGYSEGMIGSMEKIVSDTARASGLSDRYKGLSEAAESVYYSMKDFIAELGEEAGKAEYDPQEAELIARRIDYIDRLKLKYGNGYSEIMDFRKKAEERLDFLTGSEENAMIISKRLDELSKLLFETASSISKMRQEASRELSARIEKELSDLEMAGTVFDADVAFSYEPSENAAADFGPDGLDKVEFMISPNPGQPLKPLSRTASGGELSRIMLAIKNVQSAGDNTSTLIFDEIDTGISGVAANRIALKLKSVSALKQVICVTHHAQLAAIAVNHIFVSKSVSGGNTSTEVRILSGEEKVDEISRLLDGDRTSEISRSHAKELIKKGITG